MALPDNDFALQPLHIQNGGSALEDSRPVVHLSQVLDRRVLQAQSDSLEVRIGDENGRVEESRGWWLGELRLDSGDVGGIGVGEVGEGVDDASTNGDVFEERSAYL